MSAEFEHERLLVWSGIAGSWTKALNSIARDHPFGVRTFTRSAGFGGAIAKLPWLAPVTVRRLLIELLAQRLGLLGEGLVCRRGLAQKQVTFSAR